VKAPSAPELWAKIASAGMTVGDMPEAVDAHTPWYVRVMLGIAGWLAAGFLLGFVGVGLSFVLESKAASVSVGFMVIAAAYAVFRMAPRNDFSSMFGLAVSFAGQALVMFGVLGLFERHPTGATPWLIVAAIEAALAVVMPNFIHRVASAYAAGFAFVYACEIAGAHAVAAGVLAASVAFVWLQEAQFGKLLAVASPVGYGLTLALIQVEGMSSFRHSMAMLLQEKQFLGASPWIGEALVATALLASVWVLLRRAGWELREARTILGLATAAAIGAASFKAPGIAAGLMIVLLGFANGNRVLAGLGIASLLVYVSSYYYLLDATLLVKSGVLAATGAVLLGARWLVLNVVMPKEKANA
jgi:uncharacterized protein DUF4401